MKAVPYKHLMFLAFLLKSVPFPHISSCFHLCLNNSRSSFAPVAIPLQLKVLRFVMTPMSLHRCSLMQAGAERKAVMKPSHCSRHCSLSLHCWLALSRFSALHKLCCASLNCPQAMALSPSPSSSTQRRTIVCLQRGSDTVLLQDRQKSKASLTASWDGSGVVEEDGQAISQQCDSFPESFMRPVNAPWFCRHHLWEAEVGWRQISTKPLEQLKCGLGTFSPIPFPWGTQRSGVQARFRSPSSSP